MRTPVSYKCGRGSNNKKLTPSLTLPAGEGTRAVVRLTCTPRPLWEREEFQVELGRNLEIQERGSNSVKYTPSPGVNILVCGTTSRMFLQRENAHCRSIIPAPLPNPPRRRGNTLCLPINVFLAPDKRVYLPSWGGRSCANVSELQMRVGFKQRKIPPYPLRVLSWICSTLAKSHFRSRAPVCSLCSLSGLPH